MAIRSYEDIYRKFCELFPPLVPWVEGYFGAGFKHGRIFLRVKDYDTINLGMIFEYHDDENLVLTIGRGSLMDIVTNGRTVVIRSNSKYVQK